jgi:hypothetical protein
MNFCLQNFLFIVVTENGCLSKLSAVYATLGAPYLICFMKRRQTALILFIWFIFGATPSGHNAQMGAGFYLRNEKVFDYLMYRKAETESRNLRAAVYCSSILVSSAVHNNVSLCGFLCFDWTREIHFFSPAYSICFIIIPNCGYHLTFSVFW